MRKLQCIAVLFLLAAATSAQTTKAVENWQAFSPSSDEFSVDTPLTLRQEGDNHAKSSRKFFGAINGVYVYVFSDPLKTKHYFSAVRDILPKLGQSADLIDGTGVNSITFKDTFGYWHILTTLRTESRVYLAQTVTLDEKNDVASRFITSFALGPKLPFVPQSETITDIKSDEVKSSSVGQGGGQGSGRGSGNGAGSGNGVGSGGTSTNPPPPASGRTSSVRILTKARPAYTDMARIYEISGTVILRVTFLAAGEVGSISPVTRAPFGLTEKAIEAAKRITFEPAYLHGSPQTVVKQIEYSFAIF